MHIAVNYVPDLQSRFKRSKHFYDFLPWQNVRTKWKSFERFVHILLLMNRPVEVFLCCDEKAHLLAG